MVDRFLEYRLCAFCGQCFWCQGMLVVGFIAEHRKSTMQKIGQAIEIIVNCKCEC